MRKNLKLFSFFIFAVKPAEMDMFFCLKYLIEKIKTHNKNDQSKQSYYGLFFRSYVCFRYSPLSSVFKGIPCIEIPYLFLILLKASKMESLPYSKDKPPCIYRVYGSTTGASALSSIVLPCVKLPHAITSSNG